VNNEIGDRFSASAVQMERINGQVQDLRDIFAKQHYIGPEFRGSTSIKAVMPVLAPELLYDNLEIREGATRKYKKTTSRFNNSTNDISRSSISTPASLMKSRLRS
jgi:hypothetical protein